MREDDVRVLVTGATGFVGSYALSAIRAALGSAATIVALSRKGDSVASADAIGVALDVTNREAVREVVRQHQPTHILNLAGIAAPTHAAADPMASWSVHLHAVGHLAEAILAEAPECWLVHVGSGLVYGGTALGGTALTEASLLDPYDVYAASKAAGDLLLAAYSRKGLKCLRMRPFNHTGPGQSTDFVVPAFAMQIARIEAGLAEPVVRVGNLEAARDFLDVRDVARAYALAIAATGSVATPKRDFAPGTILNIASGRPVRMSEILSELLRLSRVAISIEPDPARMRPADIPQMFGDATRASELIGWQPRFGIDATLAAVLEHCRNIVNP